MNLITPSLEPKPSIQSRKAVAGGLLKGNWLVLLFFYLIQIRAEADTWNIVMQPPNGNHVPAIVGASGTIQDATTFTGFDYFEWFGINHYRFWFSPTFSKLNPTGGVTSSNSFVAAAAAVRANPWRQGTASDVYFDWNSFNSQLKPSQFLLPHFAQLGIMPMMIDTLMTTNDPLVDWGYKFEYWKQWYCYVYYFASQYGVTMYEFSNEPHAYHTFSQWKSHWLVAADAMRQAMADVNAAYGKHLKLYLCGPTEPGPYWDYSLPDPSVDVHGWGSTSWWDIHTDIFSNQDASIWNYGMYDYHKYSPDGAAQQTAITGLRSDIANASNAPSSTIPIVISEYNTATGATFASKGLDTEDINYGIGMAQILQSTTSLGSAGLGDEGGFFLFKIGAYDTNPTLENEVAYMSPNGVGNYGGVTRGGACFEMYARHFGGGKPVLGYTITAGASSGRGLAAVWDETNRAYYIYSSNVNGTNAAVTIDLSALDVVGGEPVTVARVDTNNTSQITDCLTVSASKTVAFSVPNNTAFLVWIPQGETANQSVMEPPVQDTYVMPGEGAVDHSAEPTVKISLNHSLASERRIGLLQFNLNALTNGNRFLLKLPGHNTGASPGEREILHVYGAGGGAWTAGNLTWGSAPGVGRYYTGTNTLGTATGLGALVDIEDNYEGVTSGNGTGLGLCGKFLGPVSYYSSAWTTNYLDVTSYVKSLMASNQTTATFVIARTVRYNVNQYSNRTYYTQGAYDYDGQMTEIGAAENPNPGCQSGLLAWRQVWMPATDVVWTGVGDHAWGNAANWTDDNIPDTTNQNAIFNTNASNAAITNTIDGTDYAANSVSIGNSNFNIGQLRFDGQSTGKSGWNILTGSLGGPYILRVNGNNGVNPVITSTCIAANINSGQGHDLKLALGLAGDNEIQVNGNVLQIQANIINASGVVAGLTKTGAGTLVLTSTETYTGNTTVNAGVLQLAGAGLISNLVSVASGATLGGSGTVGGSVTVLNGGTLSPGLSLGTLTIVSNLTLSGNLLFEVNKSTSPSNDQVVVNGSLTNTGSGVLTVTNLGPVALTVGDRFQLFNQPLPNGQALNILPPPGAGMVWKNNLSNDGSITVAAAMPATNLAISFVIPASCFLSARGGTNQSYGVFAQTNLAQPLSNWWLIGITNSDHNGLIQFMDKQATNPQRFYRFGQ